MTAVPGEPWAVSEWEPQNAFRYRLDWRGRLILQRRDRRQYGRASGCGVEWSSQEFRWRDATIFDLQDTAAPKVAPSLVRAS